MGSMQPDFAIPSEFGSELVATEPKDARSSEEILKSLKEFRPVTSEKNIWAFWHSGVDGMPAWCQRNVADWVRIQGPSWTVRILDSDPSSPNFLLRYVDKDSMPTAIVEGGMTGPFTGQHTADFVRSATIYKYGGIFMDVGILLIRRLDRVCWDQLADDSSPYNLAIATMRGENIANHFVACRKGDPFIRRWHELMLHLWEGRTEGKGAIFGSPLMKFVLDRDPNADSDVRAPLGWDFKDPVVILEYVGQILAFTRMVFCDKTDEEGFNCTDYWLKHVLTWNVLEEHWAAELLTARIGPHPRIMELLAMRRDADPTAQDYQEAYRLTWRLLTKSSLMKVTSGRGMTYTPHLGVLWSMAENEGKDCAPGTFAELLRYGSVHFEQTRKEIAYFEMDRPTETLNKTLLEP
jgi:hypothetical protein